MSPPSHSHDHGEQPPPASSLAARSLPTTVGFSLVFLGSFVAALAAIVAVNVVGNGTKLFPSTSFPPSGCIRAWKARRVEELARGPAPPRALVMGSSRVTSFREADVQAVTGLPAFNLGVTVGCPIDFVAQLRLAVDAGMTPTTLVIGVDELAFGDNPEADIYDMQLITHPGLFRELDLRDRAPIVIRILKTISVTTTRDSVRNLWRRWGRHASLEPEELEGAKPPDWDAMSEAELRIKLAAGIERLVTFWGKYLDRPDKVEGMRPTRRKLRLWNDLLDLAASRGIKVYVALLPVHPEFERRTFSPRLREIRAELGRALDESCARRGFTFRDYTDLASFGGVAEDFEDGTHMLPRNSRRLLRALLSGEPRAVVRNRVIGDDAPRAVLDR